jgi:hypothetical protein
MTEKQITHQDNAHKKKKPHSRGIQNYARHIPVALLV